MVNVNQYPSFDGMLEIVELGFDARVWRSPPNEKAFIVFMSNENQWRLNHLFHKAAMTFVLHPTGKLPDIPCNS